MRAALMRMALPVTGSSRPRRTGVARIGGARVARVSRPSKSSSCRGLRVCAGLEVTFAEGRPRSCRGEKSRSPRESPRSTSCEAYAAGCFTERERVTPVLGNRSKRRSARTRCTLHAIRYGATQSFSFFCELFATSTRALVQVVRHQPLDIIAPVTSPAFASTSFACCGRARRPRRVSFDVAPGEIMASWGPTEPARPRRCRCSPH